MEICKESYPDPTQFDVNSKYYDEHANHEAPKWYTVDVKFSRRFRFSDKKTKQKNLLSLQHMKQLREGTPLSDMKLFTQSRLSVIPLTSAQYDFLLSLEEKQTE